MTFPTADPDTGVPVFGGIARLLPAVQHYAWGDAEQLPRLLGRDPDGRPWAEAWFGAHEKSPGLLVTDDGELPLDQVIARDRDRTLGAAGTRGSDRLPFLLKILTIGVPLSVQVHPTAAYLDRSSDVPVELGPKPEAVCALTPMDVLVGLAAADSVVAEFDRLAATAGAQDAEPLRELASMVGQRGVAEAFRSLLAPGAGRRLVGPVRRAHEAGDARSLVGLLLQTFGDDDGVPLALLMDHVRLAPGETVTVPTGCPHAYLGGSAVEVMASSDAVLRAGLTPKPVDRVGVAAALDAEARPERVDLLAGLGSAEPGAGGASRAGYTFRRWDLNGEVDLPGREPAVLLCTAGELSGGVEVSGEMRTAFTLTCGQAVFVPAAAPPMRVRGDGQFFRAGPPPLD